MLPFAIDVLGIFKRYGLERAVRIRNANLARLRRAAIKGHGSTRSLCARNANLARLRRAAIKGHGSTRSLCARNANLARLRRAVIKRHGSTRSPNRRNSPGHCDGATDSWPCSTSVAFRNLPCMILSILVLHTTHACKQNYERISMGFGPCRRTA